MKTTLLKIGLFCLMTSNFGGNKSNAQDTFNVFFGFGLAHLKDESKQTIDNIRYLYHSASIDSLWFVGMADTTGPSFFNKRLALKRAKNSAEYFTENIRDTIPFRILSRGEIDEDNFETSRRVSIIVYITLIEALKPEKDTVCYYLANNLLQRSTKVVIGKGDNKYVKLTTEYFNKSAIGGEPLYYYGWFDADGQFKIKRINFDYKITGKLWWRKRRYEAEIPYESYRLYKIFSMGSQPCGMCKLSFEPDEKVKTDSALFVDQTLMKYLQYRKLPWKSKSIDYRVPAEFVDDYLVYYESCDTSKIINWVKPKDEVAPEKYYAYTKVTNRDNFIPSIVSYRPICHSDPKICDSFICFLCGTRSTNRRINWNFFAEPGSINNEKLSDYYFGLGLELRSSKFSHRLSLNQTFQLMPFMKYNMRYYFFEKYKKYVKPTFGWTSVGHPRSAHYSVNLYAGVQLLVFSEQNSWAYNPCLLLGIEFYNYKRLKVFGQTGVFNTYLFPNGRRNFIDNINYGINYIIFK